MRGSLQRMSPSTVSRSCWPHGVSAYTIALAARPFLADLRRGLESLTDLPTLLVWADADIAFRTKELRRWETLMNRHHTVVLPGAGHFLQSDAPTDFANAVTAWWSQR
jgi:haloalkane dehalogenase